MKKLVLNTLVVFATCFYSCESNMQEKKSPVSVTTHSGDNYILDIQAFNQLESFEKISEMQFAAIRKMSASAVPGIFHSTYSYDATDINRLLGTQGSFNKIVAVLGIDELNNFEVNFMGVGRDTTKLDPTTHENYPRVKMSNERLVKRLATSIPFGLPKFPLMIKMNKSDFEAIRNGTNCPNYLALIGIDPRDEQHFTISILGSAPVDQNDTEGKYKYTVNRQHIENDLPGGESWPDNHFTYYNYNRRTDIKFP